MGEGGGRSLGGAGPRGERAPPPRIQNEGDWSGRSWARGSREETGDVVGLRSVVGFLLHPTWRDKGGKTQRQRQRHRKKPKGAETQGKTPEGGGRERRGEGRGAKGMERQRGWEEGVREGGEEGEDRVRLASSPGGALPPPAPAARSHSPQPPTSTPVSPSPPGFLRRMSLRISS